MIAVSDSREANRHTLVHVLYAMHAVSWASLGSLAVVALIINYIRRTDEGDGLLRVHHAYMIRTFWWTLLWLFLALPLWLLWLPGLLAYGVIGLWHLYRCLRGWLRFNDQREP